MKMNAYYQEPDHTIYCGHALDILREMPDESVDMVITSPPYWGLRTYKTEPIIWGDNHCEHEWEIETIISNPQSWSDKSGLWADGRAEESRQKTILERAQRNRGVSTYQQGFCLKCHAWKGELGLEPTIELYIEHLILIFNEVKRVLKKTGTCWVNLDDSYAGSGKASGQSIDHVTPKQATNFASAHINIDSGMPPKSLCLIPQRFAIAMVNSGWLLRNDVVWNKPNPMPESVKDRFTGSWEHLFFFVKNKRYFFEQQFEPVAESTIGRGLVDFGGAKGRNYRPAADDPNYRHGSEQWGRTFDYTQSCALGRNKRDVWEIATEPYPEAHFATFPEKLCETPILAGCPKDGVVLDPFCGSGKALAVAKKLGRKSVGIDLNPNYCNLSVKTLQAIPLAMPLLVA